MVKLYHLLGMAVAGSVVVGSLATYGIYSAYQNFNEADQQQLKVENVIGGEGLETFLEVDGKRLYKKIDGKSVED